MRLGVFFDRHIKWICVLPALLIMFGVIIYPLGYNVHISLFDERLVTFATGGAKFVGLRNFYEVVTGLFFTKIARTTLIFVVSSVSLQAVLGFIMAVIFDKGLRGERVALTLLLIPIMTTPVIIGLTWRFILDYNFGVLNYFFELLGFQRHLWLVTPSLAMPAVVSIEVWWGVPFITLVLLGGLRSLPIEPREAAMVDGASSWQVFAHITFPLLRPTLLAVTLIRTIDAMNAFATIYTLTGGGPGTATRVIALEIYQRAFRAGYLGEAAALSLLLLAVLALLNIALIRSLQIEISL